MPDPQKAPAAAAPDGGEPRDGQIKTEQPIQGDDGQGGDPPAGDPPALSADPNAAPADPPADPPPADWPDDWREKLAGNDAKLLARLKRFASPSNVMRSWLEADGKIRSGQYKQALPEGASAEEVQAYRKAVGIPETAEGYEIPTPEGVDLGDDDKQALEGFKAFAHERNMTPEAVKAAGEFYFQLRQQAELDAYTAAQEATVNQRAELRAEMGRDFDRNVRLADQFLASHLGDQGPELMATTLADGTKLGDHPAFVRLAVAAALAQADDTALATSELPGGKSVEDAYREALALKFTDPTAYHSESHQQKLMRLAAAKKKSAA